MRQSPGTGAAIALDHYRFKGHSVVQLAVMLPVSLPGIVLGLGLLLILSPYGMRPGKIAAIFGHATVSIPYVVAMVTAALSNYDRALERASLNLAVSPARTFIKITLHLIRGGVIAGAISAFLISLDNFSLSLFITRGDTLSLRLMQQLLFYADLSIAAKATILLALSLGLMIMMLPMPVANTVLDREYPSSLTKTRKKGDVTQPASKVTRDDVRLVFVKPPITN